MDKEQNTVFDKISNGFRLSEEMYQMIVESIEDQKKKKKRDEIINDRKGSKIKNRNESKI